MRYLFLGLLFIAFGFAKASIDSQIKSTNAKLKNYDKRYKNAHHNLSKSAKNILNQQKKMLQLDLQLQTLNADLEKNLTLYNNSKKELVGLQEKKTELTQTKESMRKELSRLIAKQLSLELILKQRSFSDVKDLMRGEIFTAMSRLTNQELASIKKNISEVLVNEENISTKMNTLTSAMSIIDNKRKKVVRLKNEQKKILTKLDQQRKNYKKDLEKSLTTKANLSKMLKKLQIIKVDQVKLAKKRAKEKAAKKARLASIKAGKAVKKIKVVQHGKSYEKVKTKKYRGRKTIAPLKNYTVIKKFGPYTDPVYDFKIFNDSISMKPKKKNAIVRSILNGKVVISKSNNLLGNFIIIEHAQGLHSVYAHLDKVSPTVRQGKRIKKGSAIGRVNSELMFQVTQKNHHLNPLEVIR